MLSDGTILAELVTGRIVITPRPPVSAFQPASVDLRLGHEFIQLTQSGLHRPVKYLQTQESVWLAPHACALACTIERITLASDIAARVEGKSTWGRKFLMIHSTAGFIDPGFDGQITLELVNLSPRPVELKLREPIAQISFERLDAPARRPYGHPELNSKYQGQTGATPAYVLA